MEDHARPGPVHLRGDRRADPLGRPRLERPPRLRPPDPRRRHPPGLAGFPHGAGRPASGKPDLHQRHDAPPGRRHRRALREVRFGLGIRRHASPGPDRHAPIRGAQRRPRLRPEPPGFQALKISPGAKKRAISTLAFSTLSDACTTFLIISVPKSPRMVPFGAFREPVGPSRSRTFATTDCPWSAMTITGRELMNFSISG